MNLVWESSENSIISIVLFFVILFIVYATAYYMLFKSVKRVIPHVIFILSFILIIVCYIFCLKEALIVVSGITSAFVAGTLFANIGDLRKFFANPFKRAQVKTRSKNNVEKIYDRHALYKVIDDAVQSLSAKKIGALLTFEKSDDLSNFSKNGISIDAPVTKELLMTIFYPGTRLHDGAVIIHGNRIESASVFYTPSTKAFTGKYGSRHRAAIGISEVCDAVTVVVSEETGRISFAVNGQIEAISSDMFLRVFENYMMTDEDRKLEDYE